jgi:hypothetical protein
VPKVPLNSCVIGFLILMRLIFSSRSGSLLRLMTSYQHVRFFIVDPQCTYHSSGGITLTIPDFIPYLSTFSINFLKLLNCTIVGLKTGMLPPSQ